MAKLPGSEALGERPVPVLPRRTPMIAEYRPTTGFEGAEAEQLAHSASEFQSASNVVLQAKEQTDTLAAEDAYNKLRTKQIDLTFGPNGIVNQKGAATVNRDLPAEYGGQLTASANELSNGLGNDNQRKLFSLRSATAQRQLQEHAFQHVARESDVYANQVLEGTLDTESRLVSAGGDVPTSLLRVNAAIDRNADRFHQSEQTVTALKMKAADSILTAKIRSLVYTNPQAAKTMFDEPSINARIGQGNRIILEHELHTVIRPIEAKGVAEQAMAPQAVQAAGVQMEVGGEPTVTAVANTEQGEPAPPGALPANKRDLRAQLGDYVVRGEALAEKLHPGDAVFRDQVVSQIKGKIATLAAVFEGEQRQAHGTLLTHLSGGPEGKGPKPTTLDELMALPGAREAYTKLDAGSLHGISAAIQHNQIESMGRPAKTDPKVEKALFDRIHLPDDDPRKISSPAQLTPFFAQGINQGSYDWLKRELDQQQSAGGRNFTSDVREAINSAHRRFLTSPIGSLQPDKAEDASYKFRFDLSAKIDEYRKAGKDPRGLITPGNTDFMLTPDRLATYMPSTRASIGAQTSEKLPVVESDADYEKLEPGTAFVDKAGKSWQKPGQKKPPAPTPAPGTYGEGS